MIKFLAIPLVLLVLAGCAKNQIHPNQIDAFDGKTYDLLNVAQATLDQAKVEFKAGNLPADSSTLIDHTGAAYNSLRDAWLGYRAFKQAGKDASGYVAQINALVPQINQFIADLKTLLGRRADIAPIQIISGGSVIHYSHFENNGLGRTAGEVH